MSRLLNILGVIMLIALPTYGLGEEGMGVYRNSDYQFRFIYPSDWKTEQPDYEETVVEIKSPDRKLSFNVAAARDIALKKVKPDEFVKKFSKEKINDMYEKEFTDFKLIEAREMTLCAYPAYYWIYTFSSYDAENKQITLKSITVTTNRSEIQYTLTAAGEMDEFDKKRAVLDSIIDSFTTGATLWQ